LIEVKVTRVGPEQGLGTVDALKIAEEKLWQLNLPRAVSSRDSKKDRG
jgi:hypothetical protein